MDAIIRNTATLLAALDLATDVWASDALIAERNGDAALAQHYRREIEKAEEVRETLA